MKTLGFVLCLLTAVTASCIHDYDSALHGGKFSYTGLGGPLNWHGLDKKHNSLCARGRNQSPINIDSSIHTGTGRLSLSIPASIAVFENLGPTVEVTLPKGQLFTRTGKYALQQFHFHTPSEHRINDEYYPLEVHFVFKDTADRIAVVAFVFELSENGRGDALFENILSLVQNIAIPGKATRTGRLMFGDLASHLESNLAYEYSGSLTTPPCTEHVSWFISAKPLSLSVKNYNAVKHVLKFNSRYTQNTPGQDNLLEVAACQIPAITTEFESGRQELR
ncbi:uncharacterized protein N7511_001121 [Penicillium nucicola]|uniref:uncharacterized protein n=1 Tax=Penicillium nucicola TaxID=1850975 RepID=UPI0025456A76|nr:uncharacterized protein N7511_001121 [Penicillium nucicola]KAJ5776110.1 hypothetical protein N7511_001121 [Penicillium nucicola]